MERYYGLDGIPRAEAAVVTVGTFDGVHVGHQAILRYLVGRSSERGAPSVLVTFDPHPREVVHGEEVPLLTTVEERGDAVEALGLDRFVVVPFSRVFAKLPPEVFVREVLVERIGLGEVVVGYDHGFGRGRSGDRELLERLGAELGFAVDVMPPQVVGEDVVSSSEIRCALVEEGDLARAAALLGRRYALEGQVVRGEGRGRTIGFPTANLEGMHPRKVVPREGVYAVLVHRRATGGVYGGMMNIGRRPTFDGTGVRLEVHLFDFEGDLYGERLRVEFVEWVREERRFGGVEALVGQLSADQTRCKGALQGLY